MAALSFSDLWWWLSLILAHSANCASSQIEDLIDWHTTCDMHTSCNASKKAYGVSREEMSWDEAQKFCDSAGDGLATFKNWAEEKAFFEAWGKCSGVDSGDH